MSDEKHSLFTLADLVHAARAGVPGIKALQAAENFTLSMLTIQNQAGQSAAHLAPLSDAILRMAEEDEA